MIFRLFRPDPRTATIRSLYGTIVAQARLPEFYARYAVPDTVEGRFEMIVLHLALFLRRLRRETGEAQALGQAVFDLFCRDMDHNLREMGVGDLRVPKEMRRLAEAFYGRLEAYDRGLNATTPEILTATLARNVLAGVSANAERLAIYVTETARMLDNQPAADFLAGRLAFPELRAEPAETTRAGEETRQ